MTSTSSTRTAARSRRGGRPRPRARRCLRRGRGGHAADRLLTEGAAVERGIDSLASVLGVPRRRVASKLDAAYTHDWQADPFSRGAYSYPGVGGSTAYRALAKPVADTLFFAGEATSEMTGTVAGAISSGRRAARQILGRR